MFKAIKLFLGGRQQRVKLFNLLSMSVALLGDHLLDLGHALEVHLLQFGFQPRYFILFFLEGGELALLENFLLDYTNTTSSVQVQQKREMQNNAWRETYLGGPQPS